MPADTLDWGAPIDRPSGVASHLEFVLPLILFVVVAALATILLGPIVGPVPVLVIDAGLVLTFFWWVNNQGLLALRSAEAVRSKREDEPRVWNIAQGLATDLGLKTPTIYVIDEGEPNAFICIARGPSLAVTRSVLDEFTRTELEAVVAHCLVRLKAGSIERSMMAVAFGPLGKRGVPPVGWSDDIRACALTRYPPALADAIEKASPRTGRFAAFWFVADGGGHRDRADRVAAIQDL